MKKRILRVKISYRRHTSGSDIQQRPQLYKVNQLSLAEMKIIMTDDLFYFRSCKRYLKCMALEGKCAQKRQMHTHSLSTIFWTFWLWPVCVISQIFSKKYSSKITETACMFNKTYELSAFLKILYFRMAHARKKYILKQFFLKHYKNDMAFMNFTSW